MCVCVCVCVSVCGCVWAAAGGCACTPAHTRRAPTFAHSARESASRSTKAPGTNGTSRLITRGAPAASAAALGVRPARTAPASGSLLPHLRQDCTHPCHICAGTGRTCARQHQELAHLHRDCFHHCHICAGTGWTTARLRVRARSEPTRRRASRACSAAAAPLRNAARKSTAEHRTAPFPLSRSNSTRLPLRRRVAAAVLRNLSAFRRPRPRGSPVRPTPPAQFPLSPSDALAPPDSHLLAAPARAVPA